MKQAKVLSDLEMKRLLALIAVSRHAHRDRFVLMLSHLAGLRVGEIASLKIGDLFEQDRAVRHQVRLKAENTKGNIARTIFINERLQKEAIRYLGSLRNFDKNKPLISTQKKSAFSANTLCQHLRTLYAKACIEGGSSHSGRRWFITKLAHKGVSAKVIMTLAGHKHLSTTQRYIEVNDDMLKAAVDTL